MSTRRSLLRKHLRLLNESSAGSENEPPSHPVTDDPAAVAVTSTPPPRERLDAWEPDFSARISSVQLIGELNLARDEFEQFANDVRDVIHRHGDQRLISRYPCCLATFLVFCGIYGYEQGNFWSSVTDRVGQNIARAEVARGFERVLIERRLERFPQFDEHSAQRFVSRILAHGGVPDYCLSDFFDLLAYSLARPEWRTMQVRELVAEWESRRFSFVQIDMPIQRFLTAGGATAHDFLQRSIDMVEPALESGSPIDSVQTGLPFRIGEAFNRWIAQRGVPGQGTHAPGVRRRLATPRLSIDPWGREGLILRLPSQSVDRDTQRVAWSLGFGSRTRIIDVTPGRGATQCREAEVVLDEPAGRWDVTLLVNGEEQSTWRFAGLPAHRPVLGFDPDSFDVVRAPDAIPAGDIVLLYPANCALSINAAGLERTLEIQERFPPLSGQWRNFQVALVTLPAAGSIVVRQPDGARSAVVAVQERDNDVGRPQSDINQHRIETLWAGDERAPVVSRAPSLLIPGTDAEAAVAERWTVVLTAREGSVPGERVVRNVSELESDRDAGGGIVVDLAQSKLLGTGAIGTYSASVRGPLGKDARFDFALLPGLTIRGQSSHETINREHGTPARIELRSTIPIATRCIDPNVLLHRVQDGFDLTASGKAVSLALSPVANGTQALTQNAAVELHVPLAGIRWTTIGGGGDGQLIWSSQPLTLPQDLVGTGDVALLVEGYTVGHLPLPSSAGRLRLTLRDAAGQQRQELVVPIHGPRVWASLREFSTVIASSNDAAMTIAIDITDSTGAALALARDVLRLTRELVIGDLALTDTGIVDDRRHISITWMQPHRVNDRVLRLSSQARPWESPHIIVIPDTAQSSLSFEADDMLLPPGPYLAEIVVVNPWIGTTAQRAAGTSFAVQIGSHDEIVARAEIPATTSFELLEQFMLVPETHRLRGLRAMLDSEDPSPAITVLSSLTTTADNDIREDESYLEAAILTLREALIDHVDLLHALVERHTVEQSHTESDRSGLSGIVVGLGLPQIDANHLRSMIDGLPPSERAVLEREAPWLFLSRIGDQLLATDVQREDADLLLGQQPLATLLPVLGPNEIREQPWMNRTDEMAIAFGYPIDPIACRMPVAQLEMIRQTIGLAPTGILDRDAYDLATFDWLLALNHPRRMMRKQRIVNWLANAVPRIESELDTLDDDLATSRIGKRAPGLRAAIAVVGRRLSNDLAGVALLQRLIARHPSNGGSIRFSESQLMEYGRFAAFAAPGIYSHDLCLFDLLVTRPSVETGQPASDDDEDGGEREMEDANGEE